MMKQNFLVLIGLVLAASVSHAGAISENDAIRPRMTYSEAMTACPSGTHLPTARELAKMSQDGGAVGILELNEVDSHQVPKGYIIISALNPDGKMDQFYFNPSGYRSVNVDALNGTIWSSSVFAEYSPSSPSLPPGYPRTGDQLKLYPYSLSLFYGRLAYTNFGDKYTYTKSGSVSSVVQGVSMPNSEFSFSVLCFPGN